MATTKIWPIHGNLSCVIDYISNPEKTVGNDEIYKLLHYVSNEKKTAGEDAGSKEKVMFVTTLNIVGDPAEAMRDTEKRFGKTGGVTIYHAYQSFKPGEVTPEICHEIGVKLARKMWGSRYQVVVTSHLDHAHLHNHFAICPVSFIEGKKYNENIGEYRKMREESDRLCREYGLSVIEMPKKKTPRKIHEREKNGEPTKYSLMRRTMISTMKVSTSWEDFCHRMHDSGYDFDPNFGGKYAKIKRKSDDKWTRIYHCGDEFTRRKMQSVFDANRQSGMRDYYAYYWVERYRNPTFASPRHELSHDRALHYMPMLLGLLFQFIYLAGGPDLIGHSEPCPRYTPITPEMIEARRFLEQVSRQVVIIAREKLETKGDVNDYLEKLEVVIVAEEDNRRKLYNRIRNCKDADEISVMREEIHSISEKLKPIRVEKKDLTALMLRCGEMEERVRAEEQARHRKVAREYTLTQAQYDEWKDDIESDDYIPLAERKEICREPVQRKQPMPRTRSRGEER